MLRLLLLGPFAVERDGQRLLQSELSKPKLIAVLSYLAAAHSSASRSRDTLLALFWPKRDEAAARHALRQTLFELRQLLGEDVLDGRSGGEVALGSAVWSDVQAFREALERDEPEAALSGYRGELLAGFHVSVNRRAILE